MSAGHDSNELSPKSKLTNWKRRLLRAVLIYVAIPYFAIVLIFRVGQRWIIYQPTKTDRLGAQSNRTPIVASTTSSFTRTTG